MADYEIVDLKEAIARVEHQPLTEAELWALVERGDKSIAWYQIRAAKIEARQRYEEWIESPTPTMLPA